MHRSVFINNHTAVWGSWYSASTGQWGYSCCHSTIHASYCAGSVALEAEKATSAQNLLMSAAAANTSVAAERDSKSLADAHRERLEQGESRKREEQKFGKRMLGEGDVELDDERLAAAIREEKKRKLRGDEEEEEWRSKKKEKSSLSTGKHEVTEEELGKSSSNSSVVGGDAKASYRGVPEK